jgi:hypothetical protein
MNFDEQNIIAILGIQSLPDERKVEILNQMTDLLQKRLLVRMVKELSVDDQEKLADTLEQGEELATQQFISEHFPDFPAWINEEVNNLKQELSDYLKTIN